ncbi:FAD-binding oxidoreductase [Neosynechococcus sphagnicola]|uniref:FAD-binding oxidoreductase n=1 Tax=Neosynechococcus sphagnicola TaxID=1501145 RepID=UPI0009DDC284|nr:FAD-binding oxidoreductase [Neosynechococcus sphagnicola]
MSSSSAIAQACIDQLGAEAVTTWEDLALTQQQKFRQAVTPETQISCVVSPTTLEELGAIMAAAHRHRWRVLPCGRGSKIHWGGLAHPIDLVVSTQRLQNLVEHAVGDLTVTVEAGMQLRELQTRLATAGQFLPLDPLYPETATLGGIVATASAGSLRQRYGGVRDLLLGISLVRADGQVAKAGGRVVKNVAGYDLMKLFTGSFGTLGILSQLTFRIYALPEASQTILLTGASDRLAQGLQTLMTTALTPTALDLLSTAMVAALGQKPGLGLLIRFQTIAAGVEEQTRRLLQLAQTLGLQPQIYQGADEAALWLQLRAMMEAPPLMTGILCKIGVESESAVAVLSQMDTWTGATVAAHLQVGSGLGLLQLAAGTGSPSLLNQMRSLCQRHRGFLTLLAAPMALKQQVDIWGYSGNALPLMQGLKAQFDPQQLFSPHRFVGGI